MRGSDVSDNSVRGQACRGVRVRSEESRRIADHLHLVSVQMSPYGDKRDREQEEREDGYDICHAHPLLGEHYRDQLATPFLLLLLYLWKTDQLDLRRFWVEELAVPEVVRRGPRRAKVVSECEAVMWQTYCRVMYGGEIARHIWQSWRNNHPLTDENGNIQYHPADARRRMPASLPFTNHTRFSPPSALGDMAFRWLKIQYAYLPIFGAFKQAVSQDGGWLFGDDALFEALTGRTGGSPFVGSAVAEKNPFTLGEGSGFKILTDYADRCFVLERQVNRGRYIMGRSVAAGAVTTIGGLIATKFVAAAVVLSCLSPVGWGLAAVFCVGLLIRAVANFKMHQENQKLKQEIELRNTGGMCGLFPTLPKGESVPKTFPDMCNIEGSSKAIRKLEDEKSDLLAAIDKARKEIDLNSIPLSRYALMPRDGSYYAQEEHIQSEVARYRNKNKEIEGKIKALSAEVKRVGEEIRQAKAVVLAEKKAVPVLQSLHFYAQHLRKGYQPGSADQDQTNGAGRASAPDENRTSRISLNSQ